MQSTQSGRKNSIDADPRNAPQKGKLPGTHSSATKSKQKREKTRSASNKSLKSKLQGQKSVRFPDSIPYMTYSAFKKLTRGLETRESVAQVLRGTRFSKLSLKDKRSRLKIANRLENNFHLSNKKALFYNLKSYFDYLQKDVFQIIPVTFHVKHGLQDPEGP